MSDLTDVMGARPASANWARRGLFAVLAVAAIWGAIAWQKRRTDAPGNLAPSSIDSKSLDKNKQRGEKFTLQEALDIARDALDRVQKIDSYSCKFIKQERVDGVLLEPQTLEMKIRKSPFSVYTKYLEPEDFKGREAIYIEGENDGKLIAHTTGLQGKLLGTLRLDPEGFLAMNGCRYPIHQAGIENLLTKLLELGSNDDLFSGCQVRRLTNRKVNDRPCQCLIITQAKLRPDFPLAKVEIYLDDAWQLPVRFVAYDWSKEKTPRPLLMEDYTYMDLDLDAKLTDRDFDPENPDYEY